MRKMLSVCLLVAMMLVLALPAGAAEQQSQVVRGTYHASQTKTVYSVDITWKGLTFTYNEGSKGTWNPKTHTYDNPTAAGWAAGNGVVTITNHSNAAVTATPSYRAAGSFQNAGVNFSKSSVLVGSADNGGSYAGHAVTETINVTPYGTLPEGTNNAEIGTITITIS